jgi:predicted DNA-binding transcriptional regulator AlpA
LTTPPIPGPGLLSGPLLTTAQVAKMLGVDASTVRRWRTQHPLQGPPFIQIAERVTMYSPRDVEEWMASRRVDPRMAA